jgi:hypothetical protein
MLATGEKEDSTICHFHATTESKLKSRKFCPTIPKLLQEGSVLPKFRCMFVSGQSVHCARDEGCRYDFSGKTSTMPNTVLLVFSSEVIVIVTGKTFYFAFESGGSAHESSMIE